MTFANLERRVGSLVITLPYNGKTNQFQERAHRLSMFEPHLEACSPGHIFDRLVARYKPPQDTPVCSGRGFVWFFDGVVRALNSAVSPRPATLLEKGHFTGHRSRRGFARLALELNAPVLDIGLHGDWKSLAGFLNYAAGAAVAAGVVKRLRRTLQA